MPPRTQRPANVSRNRETVVVSTGYVQNTTETTLTDERRQPKPKKTSPWKRLKNTGKGVVNVILCCIPCVNRSDTQRKASRRRRRISKMAQRTRESESVVPSVSQLLPNHTITEVEELSGSEADNGLATDRTDVRITGNTTTRD